MVERDRYPLVFFDGECGLCDRFVQFVLTHDEGGRMRFAPLQGDTARQTLPPLGGDPTALTTVYVVTADGRLLSRSRAVLHVLGLLGPAWRAFATIAHIVPPPLADIAYAAVARWRYRIFGRLDACRIPRPDERARFLA